MKDPRPDYYALINNLPHDAKIVYKEGFFWTLLHYIVMICTFGGNRQFNTFVTTIGPWIGFPASWKDQSGAEEYSFVNKLAVVRHELKHVRQFKLFGLGISPILGIIPLFICYAFLPIPLGFAWCRWAFERVGYVETIKTYVEYLGPEVKEDYVQWCAAQITGGNYGYTMPFPNYVRTWFRNNS